MKKIIYTLILCLNFAYAEKTVLITGGAGFIGSNFLEYMFENYPDYNYIVLDALTYAGNLDNIPKSIQTAENFKFVHGTITNFPLVDQLMQQATFVVHFAAETHVTRSIADDYVFFETDVLGTRALMASLVKNIDTVERFIHISTSEVYGTAEYHPMDEAHPLNARSPYAAAKVGADRLVYAYGCTYDVPVVIIRPFNNYGPRQHLEKVIPRFISAALSGEPLTIHGDGSQLRDWVYVRDCCVAIERALHTPDFSTLKNQEINIGTGKTYSVLEIAQLILNYYQLPLSTIKFVGNRPGQVDMHLSCKGKPKRLLNWEATTPFEEGLVKTIQWYESHPEFWQRLKDSATIKIKAKNGQIELQ